MQIFETFLGQLFATVDFISSTDAVRLSITAPRTADAKNVRSQTHPLQKSDFLKENTDYSIYI